ncbi:MULTISPECIES: hypothetical protein [Pseudoalteromonas]|uniref:Aminomethyltransferase folate-binding domain-containing protein n=1 Tax=Pseudoalteromonas rubra TaxID=43658 RepID=A0A5S3UTF0_9GAMM|nr:MULTISPECIES: hypothetical protein [Pseudoalteromonas]MCG7563426.1 hypothetical protein [Pseudoalteromonas sp. McH1-42]MEC4091397.1 hypothetical protein [Pseudoalteromonas rubra]QPB82437.1 hypothetical protein CWC22_005320 [Pseudoalteromonas rubra]
MMSTPIIFAKHRQGTVAAENRLFSPQDLVVLDFSGFETTPFLNQELGLNLNKLMAPGLGVQGLLVGGQSFAVYYFSETAYRFVLSESAAQALSALVSKHDSDYDIELVRRSDLAIAQLSGQAALETVLNSFSLTPGLQISDELACYGKQSGDVFVTTLVQQGQQHYQLIANQESLSLWQARLVEQGFAHSDEHAPN